MHEYMEYIRKTFDRTTEWNDDNSYSNILETTENLINFPLPQGTSLRISSQASPYSFTSYTLSSLGLVNGSVAYLYSSRPLLNVDTTSAINLHNVVSSYRILSPLNPPPDSMYLEKWHAGHRVDTKDTLAYGRLYLPGSALEAMLIRRLSPASQILVQCVSDGAATAYSGGAVTFNYQHDTGRYRHELIYSTYESLVGFRALYNLVANSRPSPSRLSLGMEIFYGVSSKSPGFSTALRYTTQSAYTGTPLTLTLMCNPLMGHFSTSYAVHTTTSSSFASRFDFNVYSYVSDLSIGCEFWRTLPIANAGDSVDPPATTVRTTPADNFLTASPEDFSSVFKASTSLGSQELKLLWEGRFRQFLVSTGISLKLAGPAPVATGVGVEFQFSS